MKTNLKAPRLSVFCSLSIRRCDSLVPIVATTSLTSVSHINKAAIVSNLHTATRTYPLAFIVTFNPKASILDYFTAKFKQTINDRKSSFDSHFSNCCFRSN